MSLAEELLNLRRELAAASSPLQRMQMLARSWRSVRQLSPAERKQLSKAVGAEGLEGVLDRIAARKGRVGASFLVPSLAKFREMDPDALGRLIEALRNPERRRQVLERSASAVGDVLYEKPSEESETEEAIDDEEVDLEAEADAETEVDAEVEGEMVLEVEVASPVRAGAHPVDDKVPEPPIVEPVPEPPAPAPRIETVPSPPVPAVKARQLPVTSSSAPSGPHGQAAFDHVRRAPNLGRRLALAREALDARFGWDSDRVRALLDVFPQEWARRRILTEMLKRGIVDTPRAIDLIGSLDSRASRRWCVSFLLHERELSETERQALLALR